MAGNLDLIKQYLIGIGFQIDGDSFKKANSSINDAENNIKKFNENNKKGFSESGDSMKDLFSLFNIFVQGIEKLSPELRTPFQNMMKDILILLKLYAQFNDQIKKQNDNKSQGAKKETQEQTFSKNDNKTDSKDLTTIATGELQNTNLVDQILNAKDASKNLSEEGTANIAKFSLGAVAKFALVATAIVGVIAGIAKLISGISDLGKQDIQNEKLSRQLWTTKENAKEVDMAIKTLGVSMQDLWLSPTLLKQFNQLRQDSKNLQLPKEYTDNLKIVQGIGLEFARLRQLGSLAFQWIGSSILKYAAGPLNDLRQTIKDLNDWLIKNIPNVGKTIGEILGILVKIVSIIVKIGAEALKLAAPLISLIGIVANIGTAFDKLPEPVKAAFKTIIALIVSATFPIITLLALLDDVMTYFKGGKSLTGTFIDEIGKKFAYVEGKIKSVIEWFKQLKAEIENSRVAKWFDSVKNDFQGLVGDIGSKINGISAPNMNNLASNYVTSNIRNTNSSTTTTQNSHNTIKNDNKFYVYGGGDANSTGKAVKNNVNGLILRNLQGGY